MGLVRLEELLLGLCTLILCLHLVPFFGCLEVDVEREMIWVFWVDLIWQGKGSEEVNGSLE